MLTLATIRLCSLPLNMNVKVRTLAFPALVVLGKLTELHLLLSGPRDAPSPARGCQHEDPNAR